VAEVTNPVQTTTISSGGEEALATLESTVASGAINNSSLSALQRAASPAQDAGLKVTYGGQVYPGWNPNVGETPELIGVVIAFLILLVALGALVAAGMPILNALIGLAISVSGILALASVVNIATVSTTVAIMLGLSTRDRLRLVHPVAAFGVGATSGQAKDLAVKLTRPGQIPRRHRNEVHALDFDHSRSSLPRPMASRRTWRASRRAKSVCTIEHQPCPACHQASASSPPENPAGGLPLRPTADPEQNYGEARIGPATQPNGRSVGHFTQPVEHRLGGPRVLIRVDCRRARTSAR
jgi:hypothetical protein